MSVSLFVLNFIIKISAISLPKLCSLLHEYKVVMKYI